MGTLEDWRKGKLKSRKDGWARVWRGKPKETLWGGSEFELADSHVDVRYCIVAMTALYGRTQ